MDSYLDLSAVTEAASLINESIISKGYIDSPLLFNSVNWEELKKGQSSDIPLTITDTIYNNDKKTINIIYSLNQSVDRNKQQNMAFNQIITQKDQEIRKLHEKVQALESKVNRQESTMVASEQTRLALTRHMSSLEADNKAKARDLAKIKNWCNDIKTKHEIELKKKNKAISSLKYQLIQKKHLSTTVTYGLRSSIDSKNGQIGNDFDMDQNSNLVYNNFPIMDNLNDTNLPVPIINAQYEEIVLTLTDLTSNLITENHKFSRFIKYLTRYYSLFNQAITPETEAAELPDPSRYLEFEELNHLDEQEIDVDNIETFEFIVKPILNSIHKSYHYLNSFFDEIRVEARPDDVDDEVERLRRELDIMTDNYNDAIKQIDERK